MSSLHDDLTSITNDREATISKGKSKVKYPSGWEPRVTISDDSGEAVSGAVPEPNADEDALLAGWLLDPKDWRIVPGSLLVNRWMGYPKDGEDVWLYQYKAKVIRRASLEHVDVEELVKVIQRHKPLKLKRGGDEAFVANLSDWQIGKGENGGTAGTIDRILHSFTKTENQIKKLRKGGHQIGTIYVVGMGDLAERCANNYSNQEFTTDMNEREQQRVVRRLLLKFITRMATLADTVIVTSVGGNHGEQRNGSSRKVTDDSDNLDVGIFETVYEALGQNPDAYGHVHFHIPDDELVVALDINGLTVAFSHGHLAKQGPNPMAKQIKWWEGQTFGKHVAGDADVLVTAHYHHFAATESHGRLWLQCPAQDGGSKWYRDWTGAHSRSGMLTFVVDEFGVSNIEVL